MAVVLGVDQRIGKSIMGRLTMFKVPVEPRARLLKSMRKPT